jgi:Bacterial Ig domain
MPRNARSTLKNMKSVWAALLAVLSLALIPSQGQAQLGLGNLIVTMTSPASGSTVSGTVSVSASVTIIGALTVSSVQFRLDGGNLGAADTSAPYSVSWNTTATGNGSHTLTAVARDLLGVQYTSNSVTVTVFNAPPPPPPDTTPPTVSVTFPSSGATVSGTTSVTASAADNIGVVGVQFRLDGVNLGGEDTAAPYSVSWNTTGTANGSHTLTATARDAAGNSKTSTPVTVTVSNAPPPDTTPPTVSVTSPASGATVSGTTSVTASASDNVGVVGVQFRLDGVNLGAEDAAAPYSVSWNTTGAANGSHTLTATARDAAGNSKTSTPVTVTVNNAPPPDTTPPTVSISSPANGATVQGTLTVTASASDNVGVVGVQFFADGAPLGAEDLTAPYSASVGTTASDNGTHTLTAVARDAAGNRTTSAPVTVTISNAPPPDTTPPTVSISSPANGATVQGTLTVAASAADNVGVVGVQFFVDGANFGAEDTTAPYSTPWNTTSASNGPHVITAIARDAAGNASASAPVTVTVANAPPPPADTTPPTVSITSPNDGATVRGTVTLTASVSDNVGVVGVQFFGDGTPLGPEDATAPYSIFVDTTFSSDGTHTVTAVARDAAGNSTTSAPVTVTVANNAPPAPPPASGKRFEDTDPSVAYNGFWRSDAYAALSNGGATATDSAGAQAIFTFTGTSVSWIGGRWVEEGIARVSLDGSFVTEVDTYSKTKEVQVPLFTALDLADTSHTLTIEVTGQKNVASNFAFALVDAFDVPAVTISRLQDTDPAVAFTGSGWAQGVTGGEYSGGTAAGSQTAGDRATFTFTGTGVRWLGELGPDNGGIARVSLDGVFMKEVHTYAPSPDPGHHSIFQAEHFKATALADTSHTLTIEVTGEQDPAALRATVVVDAFDVITSGTRREETDPAISYTAGWLKGNRDHPYSQGTAAVSTIPGDRATFTFTGTSVSWIGFRGPQAGIARVILDGNVVADSLDAYAPTDVPQTTVFKLEGLAAGSHTLTVEVTGSKNPASLGAFIMVDAFDVTP